MELLNHSELALARLPSLWEDATTLRSVMSALLAPALDLETSLQSMTARTIDSAQGAQLDDIGALVLFPRAGRSDATYRLWLHARLLVLRTAGRSEDLIKLVDLLSPGSVAIDVHSLAPSTAVVEAEGLDVDPVTLHAILMTAKGAGVTLDLVWTDSQGDALIFGDYLEAEADLVHGTGDATDNNVGGVLSGVIS